MPLRTRQTFPGGAAAQSPLHFPKNLVCYTIITTGGKILENYFDMTLPKAKIDAISNLGLAHMGDCVFEILCRAYLCAGGETTVERLHRDTIRMVKATSQAAFADKMLPLLTDEELRYYRRGKNSHVHAVPKSATREQYAKATGVEALFGYLFLSGQKERANELFCRVMDETT